MNKVFLSKDFQDALKRREDRYRAKDMYVAQKTFLEWQRDRYFKISDDAYKWLKEHEKEKGTKTYDLIHFAFIDSELRANDALFELNQIKNKEAEVKDE